jgi:hypothetical protein
MSSPTNFESKILDAAKEPSSQGVLILEQLYRQAIEHEEQKSFCAAIAKALRSTQRSMLLDAWGYRLDILPLRESIGTDQTIPSGASRLWSVAIPVSIVLGLLWSLFSGGKPPVPFPDLASPVFWLGWGPISALLIIVFFAAVSRAREQRWSFGIAALIIIALPFLSGWMVWGRKDAVAALIAFHLPLLAWIVLGAAATLRVQSRPVQRMSFILKSAEVLVVSGIYLAGAGLFGLLTLGIFDVLGVHFPVNWIHRCAALGLGVLPILAVASIYNPRLSPADQDFSTGPARLMRLLTRLLLTPVLGVLAVYIVWFIPRYFWRAFEERAVLLVYDLSLAAVLLLIVLAVPHLRDEMSASWLRWLRQGIRAVCGFALILNVYSLSAVVVRTARYGISPNRHAIIGWNIVTLCVLTSIIVGQIRANASNWTERFQESFARFLPLAAFWILWVLLVSPWIR